jgi:soluble lytic murein transglycosylase-like protein
MATRAARTISYAILSAIAAGWATPGHACWDEAGRKYGISPQLLYAIAKTESGLNPKAINRGNTNGTYDVGIMQINSRWFPVLRKYGITERNLYEPCVNIEVGAWILAQNIQRHGNSWAAVAAYNAADPRRGTQYMRRVYRNFPR